MATPSPPTSTAVSRRLEVLAGVWDRALGRRVARMLRGRELLCLNYHRVANAVACDEGAVSATPSDFEWQMQWLRRHARFVGGEDIVSLVRGAAPLVEPAVCLTFDDGYVDNFAVGVDLATRYGVRATFFIVTGFVETGVVPWWDRLSYAMKHTRRQVVRVGPLGPHGPWTLDVADRLLAAHTVKGVYRALPRPLQATFVEAVEDAAGAAADAASVGELFMSWEQIRDLHRLGHTIGAHTHSHPKLSALDPREQRHELERSKRELEERLGAPVTLLAYPYGTRDAFDEVTQQIASACGFVAAFSFYGGRNSPPTRRPHDLRRMPVDRDLPRAVFTARFTSRFPL
jgi:peptidoglycan/xylan/chitin deacetylase (PgdA/CDA1 family)